MTPIRIAGVFCLLIGAALVAQQTPTFRAGVDLIQLDVSVLDKDRQPVHGLKASDFTVLEDDKPQTIEAFAEEVLPDPVAPPARWMKDVSTDVVTNNLHEKRLVMIVLDDAVIPLEPRTMKSTKEIARDVIDHLGPDDLATVIYTAMNRPKTQDFTSDHVRLSAAVDKFTPGTAVYNIDKDVGADDYIFFQYSENIIQELVSQLIALPQQRKVLIYISTGYPLDPWALTPVVIGAGGSGSSATTGVVANREEMIRLNDDLIETFHRAQRSNVTVYPIDPSGLFGVYNFALNRLMGLKRMTYDKADPIATTIARNSLNVLLENADNTGGKAIVNTNDFADGVKQIFKENGSYYLLGYRQTNPKGPGNFSRVDVRVDRKDVTVRSRRVNYAPKVDEALEKATPQVRSMAGFLPDPTTPLRVTVAPFWRPSTVPKTKADDGDVSVAITLGVQELAPIQRVVEHVDLLTRAFGTEGTSKAAQAQKADVTIRAAEPVRPGEREPQARYEILSAINLKPGRYQLRLAASNLSRQNTGSVYIDVDVPDFSKDPISLSGIVLDSATAPTSAPKDALKALLPAIPTTDREFTTAGQVRAFLRAYQGGKAPIEPVTLVTRIFDDHDAVAFSATTTLLPSRFNKDRAADISFDIPLGTLGPGGHLLNFNATVGKNTATRGVVFDVR